MSRHTVPASACECAALRIRKKLPLACVAFLQDAETNWQFDIFALAELTPGHTLSALAFHYWSQLGWFRDFPINVPQFCKFIRKIEDGYVAENPYHNRYQPKWLHH